MHPSNYATLWIKLQNEQRLVLVLKSVCLKVLSHYKAFDIYTHLLYVYTTDEFCFNTAAFKPTKPL